MQLLRRVSEARSGLLRLLGVAILLAIGVNLISDGVNHWLDWRQSLLVGIALVLVSIVFVGASQLGRLRESVEFHGAVVIYKNNVVEVPRYDLAESLSSVMEAVLGENAAFQRGWESDPVTLPIDPENKGQDRKNLDGAGAALLREALEDVYLETLSRHLSDFFGSTKLSHLVKEHLRDDLLPLLPGNRVLDTLSGPLENRIALVEAQSATGPNRHFIRMTRTTRFDDGHEEEVLIWASDGHVMFQRLDLSLPRGMKVSRVGPGHIRLDSRVLRTDLRVKFEGYGTSLDPEFINSYLGLPSHEFFGHGEMAGDIYHVNFGFESQVKWWGIFTPRGWRLHSWAESFVDSARVSLDKDAFLESIYWEATRTGLLATKKPPARSAATSRSTSGSRSSKAPSSNPASGKSKASTRGGASGSKKQPQAE